MIPLSLILRDTRAGYQLKKEGCKINHLLFMDDLKLNRNGKNSSQIDSVVQTVWSYSEDIGMKFGIDKCALLERGRLVRSEGIELLDGERVDQEGYKYLQVLQLDKTMNKKI